MQDAEAQLESEEARVLRIQLEMSQLKQESERKMNEKDEEIESMRKNHQRQLDAVTQTLEEEVKAKNEQARQKKLKEGENAELQAAVDANDKVHSKKCETEVT